MNAQRPPLRIRVPDHRLDERRYVLDVVISRWLGFTYELVVHDGASTTISLAADASARVLEVADVLLSVPDETWLTDRSLPARPFTRIKGARHLDTEGGRGSGNGPSSGAAPDLPIIYGNAGPTGAGWERTASGVRLHVDVLGSIFFLLTRYEELVRPIRDEHDRFPGSASILDPDGNLVRPLADEYADLLWSALKALWPAIERQATPFALRLTHDIDRPWSVHGQPAGGIINSIGADIVLRRDAGLAARRLRAIFDDRTGRHGRDPIDRFDLFMDVSERHGLRSTFFFQAGLAPSDLDFRYRINDPSVIALLRRVNQRGHEVALHASYISHGSAEQIEAEFAALRAACAKAGFEQATWGVRQHFLRFTAPRTWRHLAAAGFAYDSTLGFADRPGFRAGTCRPFPVFDLEDRRELTLVEHPLLAMDTTLVEYLGLGLDAAAARVRALVDSCRVRGGEAVILYHNNTLPGRRFERHYEQLVDALVPGSQPTVDGVDV